MSYPISKPGWLRLGDKDQDPRQWMGWYDGTSLRDRTVEVSVYRLVVTHPLDYRDHLVKLDAMPHPYMPMLIPWRPLRTC